MERAFAPRTGRRLVAGLLAAAACLTPSAPASAVTMADLEMQRKVALGQLRTARAAERQARADLAAARLAYRSAYEQLQAGAAAAWMLSSERPAVDPRFVEGLQAGIGQARYAVELAKLDVHRSMIYVDEVARALIEARRQVRAAGAAAAAAQPTTRATSTIGCPVAQVSAIYADYGAPRPSGPHRGIDLPSPQGSPALASWWATVRETVTGGWMGKGIILEDASGNTWWYAHLSKIMVREGDVVAKGQTIGLVGSTGNSTGPHLHFEIHAKGTHPVDPYPLVSEACGAVDPLGPQARVAAESRNDAHDH